MLEDFLEEDVEGYCLRMSRDKIWADHIIILAMAQSLEMDIMIVTSVPDAAADKNITWIVGKAGYSGQPLLLGHYLRTTTSLYTIQQVITSEIISCPAT